MSFTLFYNVPGSRRRFIAVPDMYMGFISTDDASQIYHGLNHKSNKHPAVEQVRNSAIKLAKQRKESMHE